MSNLPWKPNDSERSVIYPIAEIIRRSTLKITIHDRGIAFTSDVFGMFPELIKRHLLFTDLASKGVKAIKVFYEPNYYNRNSETIGLLDPLHTYNVLRYTPLT